MISHALLNLCLALCIGSFILFLVPKTSKPNINVPKNAIQMAIIGVAFFSFIPILQNILLLANRMDFLKALQTVLFSFVTGKAWLITFVVSIILFLLLLLFEVEKKKLHSLVGLMLSVVLILTLGWSSHAGSIDKVWGFIGDSIHLLAVSVWVGILMMVSWFSKSTENWLKFLKWFTPVAVTCLLITTLTGIFLMNFMVNWDEYVKSWMIPYGQALLWKHILLIPLLMYACINGILINRKLKKSVDFDPRPWAKIESAIILFIFSATATLSEQSPPKETTVNNENASGLFKIFYSGQIVPDMTLSISWNLISFIFLILAILFLGLNIVSFLRKIPVGFSFLMSICVVVCVYLSLIFSVV